MRCSNVISPGDKEKSRQSTRDNIKKTANLAPGTSKETRMHCLRRIFLKQNARSGSGDTKVKLPSNLFGLIDLTYIKDKYSGFSIEDLLNVLSYLRSHKGRSHRHSDTKV